eukprot:TRINITY_DN47119_c0_g1_i1.p1 TRINITY_DN47119_c0_g1~~TRINITY_DN47119_c0_g1_i1.p1  ORF type:complete len:633 (+),score=164.96 TRINITY_DN47119_c0_g1_i1:106-2004(+)
MRAPTVAELGALEDLGVRADFRRVRRAWEERGWRAKAGGIPADAAQLLLGFRAAVTATMRLLPLHIADLYWVYLWGTPWLAPLSEALRAARAGLKPGLTFESVAELQFLGVIEPWVPGRTAAVPAGARTLVVHSRQLGPELDALPGQHPWGFRYVSHNKLWQEPEARMLGAASEAGAPVSVFLVYDDEDSESSSGDDEEEESEEEDIAAVFVGKFRVACSYGCAFRDGVFVGGRFHMLAHFEDGAPQHVTPEDPREAAATRACHPVGVYAKATAAAEETLITILDFNQSPYENLAVLLRAVQQNEIVVQDVGAEGFVEVVTQLSEGAFRNPDEVRLPIVGNCREEALQYFERGPDKARVVVSRKPRVAELRKDISLGREEAPCRIGEPRGSVQERRCLEAVAGFGYCAQIFSPLQRLPLHSGQVLRFAQPLGVMLKLEIFWVSDLIGVGLRFAESARADSYVGPFAGLLRDDAFWTAQEAGDYGVSLCESHSPEHEIRVDQRAIGNCLRFANHTDAPPDRSQWHRCNAKLRVVEQEYVGPGSTELQRVRGSPDAACCCGLFLTRDVEAGEELLWDYGPDYWTKRLPLCRLANVAAVVAGLVALTAPAARRPAKRPRAGAAGAVANQRRRTNR